MRYVLGLVFDLEDETTKQIRKKETKSLPVSSGIPGAKSHMGVRAGEIVPKLSVRSPVAWGPKTPAVSEMALSRPHGVSPSLPLCCSPLTPVDAAVIQSLVDPRGRPSPQLAEAQHFPWAFQTGCLKCPGCLPCLEESLQGISPRKTLQQ